MRLDVLVSRVKRAKRRTAARESMQKAHGYRSRDMAATLCLNSLEIGRAYRWLRTHPCHCRLPDVSPIVEFHCRGNGIGFVTICKCECGAEKDITDLDAW